MPPVPHQHGQLDDRDPSAGNEDATVNHVFGVGKNEEMLRKCTTFWTTRSAHQ
ncbi:MAG: hypothetical protein WB562_09505 [Candidatus Sulfotelmatobacter sp.]